MLSKVEFFWNTVPRGWHCVASSFANIVLGMKSDRNEQENHLLIFHVHIISTGMGARPEKLGTESG
jgi:hypothetical protein